IIINKGRIVADDKLSNLQKRNSTNIIKVRFQEPLEAEWLRRLQGVDSVNKLDTYTWMLHTAEADIVRKQLLELAVKQNLNIESLTSESQSLEDVFRVLTV